MAGISKYDSSGFSVSLPSGANFSLPDSFISDLNTKSTNLAFSLSFIDQSTTSTNSTPTLVIITLISLEDYSIIPVDLENVIKITVPLYNAETTSSPGCFFIDKNKWSNSGCKLGKISESSIECLCTHLSIFSGGEESEFVDDSEGSSNNIVCIYYTIFVLLAYIILFIWLIILDLKANNKLLSDIGKDPTARNSFISLDASRLSLKNEENKEKFEMVENFEIVEKNFKSIECPENSFEKKNRKNKKYLLRFNF